MGLQKMQIVVRQLLLNHPQRSCLGGKDKKAAKIIGNPDASPAKNTRSAQKKKRSASVSPPEPAAAKKRKTQPARKPATRSRAAKKKQSSISRASFDRQVQLRKKATAAAAAAEETKQDDEEDPFVFDSKNNKVYYSKPCEKARVVQKLADPDEIPQAVPSSSKYSTAYCFYPTNYPEKVYCNCCGTSLSWKKGQGTGSMKHHLSYCHPEVHNLLSPEPKHPTVASIIQATVDKKSGKGRGTTGTVSTAANQQASTSSPAFSTTTSGRRGTLDGHFITTPEKNVAEERAKVTQMMYMVANGRPLSDAENPDFREMLASVGEAALKTANFEFTARAIRECASKTGAAIRSHLQDRIKGKQVCATFDHWTSRAKDNYSCLHFIGLRTSSWSMLSLLCTSLKEVQRHNMLSMTS